MASADKPKEDKRPRWQRTWHQYRPVAYFILICVIIVAAIFGTYGAVNPLGWLYAAGLAAFLFLFVIYRSVK